MGRARGSRGSGRSSTSSGDSGGNWMAGAVKRPGAFTAKAKAAGKGVQEYARQVTGPSSTASPLTKKQGNLAKTFAKYRP